MGNSEAKAAREKSKEIDKALKRERPIFFNKLLIPLLGTDESGKLLFINHLKKLYPENRQEIITPGFAEDTVSVSTYDYQYHFHISVSLK
jgi:hypothetical protein